MLDLKKIDKKIELVNIDIKEKELILNFEKSFI